MRRQIRYWIIIIGLIFGFSGGLEVRPFKGILVGARYNFSLTNLYKIPTTTGNGTESTVIYSEYERFEFQK